MTGAKYVLCRWKNRLWPAKVLAGTEESAKNKGKKGFFLNVQILSLDKKIKVKSMEAKILKKSHIEDIASLLASQDKVPTPPMEELAYRRSLRVALDVLNERTCPRPERSSREEKTTQSLRAKPTEPASSLCDPSPSPLLHEDTSGRPGPTRRERVPRRLSGLPAPKEDPECQVDRRKGLGGSRGPHAPAICSAGGGSRKHRVNRSANRTTAASKRGRNPARGPSSGQRAPPASALRSPPGGGDQGPLGGHRARCLCPDTAPHGPAQLDPAEETGGARLPEEARPPSEESVELGAVPALLEEDEEDEEDEEPPRVLLYHEPRSFEVGMLVWLKYQKYPFWPAVVKSVKRREKKASVLFIEGNMDPRGKGFTVSLRRLKHFDCKEKQTLLDVAKEDFDQAIGWCVSLITDYRVRLGCGSFAGSFLEYYAADISYPVRKSIQQDVQGTRFPQLSRGDPEEPSAGSPQGRRAACRKVLPDRSRAARDRANQKLVEYIVKARGAEGHLRAILRNRKPSRWLETFLSSGPYMTCVETYLEDEEQLDLVVKYLQGVCQQAGGRLLARGRGDRIRFILDVLLPEAIICAISAVDAVDYKTAEEKYIRGPSLSYREKQIFDNQLLEERSRRC
ncbi:PWWP domain-containing DNA repair factor 3A [Hippopotamus amphibius kiboko]|uniref:PWWP domain-containing DNA repair factor 3A n=1 Tax=Hippopotamus amphibius kiboko TaxID=575201 RepID=UPI002592F5CC|nr:PWWP domain-containing DNA repair factor 3A [Hippopotamus amphibius kiboko]XP_057565735.1 PWWP domain-containing DNA repair factor 3A [Hippopotamus amphibius kiboko]